MGGCLSSIEVTSEAQIETLIKIHQTDQKVRGFFHSWLQEGATAPLPKALLEDVGFWYAARCAVRVWYMDDWNRTSSEKVLTDLESFHQEGIARDDLVAIARDDIMLDRFSPMFLDSLVQEETISACRALWMSGLANLLEVQKKKADQNLKTKPNKTKAGTGSTNPDLTKSLQMNQKYYQKPRDLYANVYAELAMNISSISMKKVNFSPICSEQKATFDPVKSSPLLEIYFEALQNLQNAQDDPALELVWLALIQSIDFSKDFALVELENAKLWDPQPLGVFMKVIAAKIVYGMADDEIECKRQMVKIIDELFEALRLYAVSVEQNYNFLNEIIQSQQDEKTRAKQWSNEDKERLITYFNQKDEPFYSHSLSSQENVKQRILSILSS